jgi:hypothetical protein
MDAIIRQRLAANSHFPPYGLTGYHIFGCSMVFRTRKQYNPLGGSSQGSAAEEDGQSKSADEEGVHQYQHSP